jgi:hypothetical protein
MFNPIWNPLLYTCVNGTGIKDWQGPLQVTNDRLPAKATNQQNPAATTRIARDEKDEEQKVGMNAVKESDDPKEGQAASIHSSEARRRKRGSTKARQRSWRLGFCGWTSISTTTTIRRLKYRQNKDPSPAW